MAEQEAIAAAREQRIGLVVGFLGIATGLFDFLRREGPHDPAEIASRTGLDSGYVKELCRAGFAFGYLEEEAGRFCLAAEAGLAGTGKGSSFLLAAIEAVFAPSVALRLLPLFRTGVRPGPGALIDPELLPWFGRFLEEQHASLFEEEILPATALFAELAEEEGLVLDLGCGNGWLLRRLLRHLPRWRGIGIDREAARLAEGREAAREEELDGRIEWIEADLLSWSGPEKARLVVVSRVVHHLWEDRRKLFALLDRITRSDGAIFVWEPCWPEDLVSLRKPARRSLAFQNLHEYAQGARLLSAEELIGAVEEAGWRAEADFFAGGAELVVAGRRK